MSWELTGPQHRLREQALELGRAWALRRGELRRHTYAEGAHHPQLWAELCAAGFPGLLVPAELDGTGVGALGAALVLEGLAEGGTPLPFPVLTHSVARAVDRVGPPALRSRLLPEVAAGRCLLTLVFTEEEAGHNYPAVKGPAPPGECTPARSREDEDVTRQPVADRRSPGAQPAFPGAQGNGRDGR